MNRKSGHISGSEFKDMIHYLSSVIVYTTHYFLGNQGCSDVVVSCGFQTESNSAESASVEQNLFFNSVSSLFSNCV